MMGINSAISRAEQLEVDIKDLQDSHDGLLELIRELPKGPDVDKERNDIIKKVDPDRKKQIKM